jgi:hypothetical protein
MATVSLAEAVHTQDRATRAFQTPLDNCRSVEFGHETIVYKRPAEDPNDPEQYVMWLDANTRLPIRISLCALDSKGKLVEIWRTDYSDWVLNAKMDAAIFRKR